jgi:hypothetical protein
VLSNAQLQILDASVCAIAVDVVNRFPLLQWTPKVLSHDQTVLHDTTVWCCP